MLLQQAHTLEMLNGNYVFTTSQTGKVELVRNTSSWCSNEADTQLYNNRNVMKVTFKGLEDNTIVEEKLAVYRNPNETVRRTFQRFD